MNKIKDFFKKIALFFKSLFVSVNGKEPKLLTALKKIGKFFKGLFVKVDDKKPGFVRLYEKPATKSILASIICILAGIFVGFIIMIILSFVTKEDTDAIGGLLTIFTGPFSSGTSAYIATNTGDMIFYSVPIILTGLSVAIAFKTGLFNIGAPGQYLMGTMCSLLVALNVHATTKFGMFAVWLLALIAGILAGALWGAITGAFKALLNVNEVIVCIMTNWIAANIVSWVFSSCKSLINTNGGKTAYLVTTKTTGAYTPKIGLDKLFPGSYIDMGIIIAIVLAIIVYIILNKTVFGYELKACGHNKDASKYAGMNEKRNIILSMAIAGGLAAAGGALYYLNPGIEFNYKSAYVSLPEQGFNGIPVALLASSNPIGVIFSGLFMRYISVGGDNLTTYGFNRYVANVIIAIIIYLAGFTKLIIDLLNKKSGSGNKDKKKKKAESAQVIENAAGVEGK